MTKPILIQVFLCTLLTIFSYGQTNTTNYGDNSGTLGNNNTFIGVRSGQNTTDNSNTFVGLNSGISNIEGRNNNFFGVNAGYGNITGVNNIHIGVNSGRNNQSGNNNVFLGHGSGLGPDDMSADNRNRNTYLGGLSGRDATGSANVFIGFQAGMSEIGSNMLVINNLDTRTPLLYGNFASGQLGVNTTVLPSNMAFAVGGNAMIEGTLFTNGKLSIGTTVDDPDYDLTVKGKIHAQEIRVDLEGAIAPDYVFYSNYDLSSLSEVEQYIQANGHLPNIPSAEQMEQNGVHLKEMNLKLLEKIEELTLYTIQQEKALEKQRLANENLEIRLAKLEALMNKQ